jgi:hypothetical protein
MIYIHFMMLELLNYILNTLKLLILNKILIKTMVWTKN